MQKTPNFYISAKSVGKGRPPVHPKNTQIFIKCPQKSIGVREYPLVGLGHKIYVKACVVEVFLVFILNQVQPHHLPVVIRICFLGR